MYHHTQLMKIYVSVYFIRFIFRSHQVIKNKNTQNYQGALKRSIGCQLWWHTSSVLEEAKTGGSLSLRPAVCSRTAVTLRNTISQRQERLKTKEVSKL